MKAGLIAAMMLLGACMGPYYEPKAPLVSYDTVEAPEECPDWKDPLISNYSNSTLANFGCADATNWVNMLADKRDMIAPRGDYTSDGEQAALVVNHNRTMPPADTSTQTSNVGMVGGGGS